jgi:uncharacterized glyoxalase superfamily protein PhnB
VGVTLAHNVSSKEKVNQDLEQAPAFGTDILKPATEPFGGCSYGDFSDADDHPWEVARESLFSSGVKFDD